MMNFRIAKASVVQLIGSSSAGKFQTVGYQTKSKSADEVEGLNRFVQPYYRNGDFDGRRTGPSKHKIAMDIDLTVSASSELDLTVIDDPEATDAARLAAIGAGLEAEQKADDEMDELFDLVWNIIMDARNEQLGVNQTTYPNLKIDSRYLNNIRKDDLVSHGNLVVLTAKARLIFSVTEQVQGDTGVVSESIDNTLIQDGDPNLNTGATVPST